MINYDIPAHSKDYIHRVGRTARGARGGRAISLVSQYDVELYQRIESALEKKLDTYPCQRDEVMIFFERGLPSYCEVYYTNFLLWIYFMNLFINFIL